MVNFVKHFFSVLTFNAVVFGIQSRCCKYQWVTNGSIASAQFRQWQFFFPVVFFSGPKTIFTHCITAILHGSIDSTHSQFIRGTWFKPIDKLSIDIVPKSLCRSVSFKKDISIGPNFTNGRLLHQTICLFLFTIYHDCTRTILMAICFARRGGYFKVYPV